MRTTEDRFCPIGLKLTIILLGPLICLVPANGFANSASCMAQKVGSRTIELDDRWRLEAEVSNGRPVTYNRHEGWQPNGGKFTPAELAAKRAQYIKILEDKLAQDSRGRNLGTIADKRLVQMFFQGNFGTIPKKDIERAFDLFERQWGTYQRACTELATQYKAAGELENYRKLLADSPIGKLFDGDVTTVERFLANGPYL